MPTEQPGWDGAERRTPTPAEVAVVLDAEKLSARRYRRERVKTIAGSVVAALIIATALSFLIGHKIGDNAKQNATSNCGVNAAGRPIGNGRAVVIGEVLKVADRAFEQFPPRFKEAQNKVIRTDINRVRRLLPANTPREIRGFEDLAKLITLLPLIDCGTVIK
jgi:hypothetical protein